MHSEPVQVYNTEILFVVYVRTLQTVLSELYVHSYSSKCVYRDILMRSGSDYIIFVLCHRVGTGRELATATASPGPRTRSGHACTTRTLRPGGGATRASRGPPASAPSAGSRPNSPRCQPSTGSDLS